MSDDKETEDVLWHRQFLLFFFFGLKAFVGPYSSFDKIGSTSVVEKFYSE